MRTIYAIVLLLLLVPASSATGDQTDSRLEELFAQLKTIGDPGTARALEITIWQIWIESDDQAVELLMEDGMAAMSRRDYQRALGKFDQIVRIAPEFAEGWNKRATVHYLVGNYGESLSDIEKTLALEPRHFGALSGRGLVYVALEEEELALESFEAALEVHPLLPGARFNAAALRKRLEDREI